MAGKCSTHLFAVILLAVVLGVVRAQFHIIRLALLAAMGLGGLYLLHLLAQDYNTIRQPARPAVKLAATALRALLVKRSIPDNLTVLYEDDKINEVVDWERILQEDPSSCARRVICEFTTQPEQKLQTDELNMLRFISSSGHSNRAHEAFITAAEIGQRLENREACSKVFPKCKLTTSYMMKLLRTSGLS